MERVPRVSVVIPTWNRKRHLEEAIESVLAQTYGDYEIVVVDDGSTDGTGAWIRGRFPDPRLVYLGQENRGSSAARNAGIRAARGELIAFLDSDDLWLPRKLELQVPLFDRPEVGFVFCACAQGDGVGAWHPMRPPGPEYRGQAVRAMIRRNMSPTPSVVIRRRLCLEAGPMNETMVFGEDWNYWLRVAARCQVDFVPEILVHYRYTPGSLSRLPFEALRWNTIELFESLYRDPETARLLAPYRRDARSKARTLVAGEALGRGRSDIARAEAWNAIRIKPWNRNAWHLLSRALLGRRFLRALQRLRRPVSGRRAHHVDGDTSDA